MSRRVNRVPFHLDPKGIRSLPDEEVKVILRGADDLIMRGGRTLLVKILRGSRSKNVLEQRLDRSPAYGFYRGLSEETVMARVDCLILNGFLALEYDYRLPLLVYTEKGWSIEKETFADELLHNLDTMLTEGPQPFDVTHLNDKNREMIWRLLEKIEASNDRKYLPALEAWDPIDYKKVQQRIRQVIQRLTEPTA